MNTIYAKYGLRSSQCSLNTLAIDEPLEYTGLYLDRTIQMISQLFYDITIYFAILIS